MHLYYSKAEKCELFLSFFARALVKSRVRPSIFVRCGCDRDIWSHLKDLVSPPLLYILIYVGEGMRRRREAKRALTVEGLGCS